MTPKEEQFCKEYLIDLNATQAAIRAGYSKKTAKEIGYENLTKPHTQEKIAELMAEREDRTNVTQDMVLEGLARVAFADIRNLFTDTGRLIDITELPDDIAMALAGIEIVTVRKEDKQNKDKSSPVEYTNKIKSNDRMKALELLGKHMAMFTDKQEHSGPGGGPLQLETNTFNFIPVGPDSGKQK